VEISKIGKPSGDHGNLILVASKAQNERMATKQPIHGQEEVQLIGLLRDVQRVLADALDSMGGKSLQPGAPAYLAWAAVSVNRAAEGYLWLRESGRVPASKLLVRPALEATFFGIAVVKKPGFFFRKLYSEWEQDKKMFANDAAVEAASNCALQDLKRAARQAFPGCPIECKRVSVREAAEAAGLLNVYNSAYRTYCKFTHGALIAVQGHLDDATDTIDTDVVVSCVLKMLNELRQHTPAQVPDLKELGKRLKATHPN